MRKYLLLQRKWLGGCIGVMGLCQPLLTSGQSPKVPPSVPEVSAERSAYFSHPYSSTCDPANGRTWISSLNGTLASESPRGWIGFMTLSGSPTNTTSPKTTFTVKLEADAIDSRWYEAVSAPRGLFFFENKLYFLQDQNTVSVIHAQTKKMERQWILRDAGRLSDLCVTEEGSVFVSDIEKNTILKINPGASESTVWMGGLHQPVSIFCYGSNRIFYTSWSDKLSTRGLWSLNGQKPLRLHHGDSPISGVQGWTKSTSSGGSSAFFMLLAVWEGGLHLLQNATWQRNVTPTIGLDPKPQITDFAVCPHKDIGLLTVAPVINQNSVIAFAMAHDGTITSETIVVREPTTGDRK